MEQGQPSIEGQLLGRLRGPDEDRGRTERHLVGVDDTVSVDVVDARDRSHPVAA